MIVIIDYGTGNLGSITKMLKRVGAQAIASRRAEDIQKADKLILPGVGAFDTGMQNLEDSGLLPVIKMAVLEECTPLLGICLGMQILTRGSEEGVRPGLNWIAADTVRFDFTDLPKPPRLPHMGWNDVVPEKRHKEFPAIHGELRFYFLHSYHVRCDHEEDVLLTTGYGYPFTSGFHRNNITGVQFHPEKSHRFGMEFMKRFAEDNFND